MVTVARTDLNLLQELEPTASILLNRRTSKPWCPYEHILWDERRDFAAPGGIDWEPDQSGLWELARLAMVTNLLTEDDPPSCHREIAEASSLVGVRGTWMGRDDRAVP